MTKAELRKEPDAVIAEARERKMIFANDRDAWSPDEAECLWPLDEYETWRRQR